MAIIYRRWAQWNIRWNNCMWLIFIAFVFGFFKHNLTDATDTDIRIVTLPLKNSNTKTLHVCNISRYGDQSYLQSPLSCFSGNNIQDTVVDISFMYNKSNTNKKLSIRNFTRQDTRKTDIQDYEQIKDTIVYLDDVRYSLMSELSLLLGKEKNTVNSRQLNSMKMKINVISSEEQELLNMIIVKYHQHNSFKDIKTSHGEILITHLGQNKQGPTDYHIGHHIIGNIAIPEAVVKEYGAVTAKIQTTRYNPFIRDMKEDFDLSMNTRSLELYDGSNKEISIVDTKMPFTFLFPRGELEPETREVLLNESLTEIVPLKMAAMKISFQTATVVFCYNVYLIENATLTQQTIDRIYQEIWNAHWAGKQTKGRIRKGPEIDVEFLQRTFGIHLEEEMCPLHIKKQRYQQPSEKIESHSCIYWNKNDDAWKHDGCWVSPSSRSDVTVCKCNHLTVFAVIVVPVNTIDFHHAFSQDLSDNSLVFSFIVVVLSIYLLVVAIMRRYDKDDVLKWAAHPLADNKEHYSYYYTISVYTGHNKGSTCRSQVAFDILGETSDTKGRVLEDAKGFLKFDQGSLNHYLMNTPASLGQLKCMTIWHDNTGEASHASWFLYWVVVCDLQTNQRYAYLCNNWLALDRSDGLIVRSLKVLNQTDSGQVQSDFFRILRENMSDDNLWMSLLNRPTPSNFNRVQRLSVCLALGFLYMISNAMFYRDSSDEESYKTVNVLGLLEVNFQAIYIATITSLIMIPANLLVVLIFRKARPRKGPVKGNLTDMTEVFQEVVPKQQATGLPWWTVYIGWLILFCAVSLSGFFVVLYTLNWGPDKSKNWFISMMTSFLESILILEPCKALFAAALVMCSAKVIKKTSDFNTMDPERVMKVEMEAKKSEDGMNIPLDEVPRIRPPNAVYLASIKKRIVKAANTQEIVHMIGSHVFFILITLAIIILYRDYYSYYATKAIDDKFMPFHKYAVGPWYDLVKFPEEYYAWANEVAVPVIFPTQAYNYDYLSKQDRRFMEGTASFRVGRVRLRQIRVTPDSCKIHNDMVKTMSECNEYYRMAIAEDRHFTEKWKNTTDDPCPWRPDDDPLACPWEYVPAENPGTSLMFGYSGIGYDGRGYIADLGTRADTAKETLRYLQKAHWFDRFTRIVVMEWVVYNANLNLFSYVNYYVEFPETNGAYPQYETHTFRLYDYSSDAELTAVFVTLLHILYIMWLIHTCFEEFENIKKAGKSYIKSVDNWAEIALVVSSTLGVIIYMIRKMAVINLKEKLEVLEYPQPLFQNISFLDKTYSYCMSIVAFMGMVKVNLLLSFDYRFTQMTRTLQMASKPIFCFTMVFGLVFFGFVALNYLGMGADTVDYKSILATSESLMTTLLGKFRFATSQDQTRIFGMIVFSGFCLIQGFILLTMFMSIIIDAFSVVKKEDESLKDAIILEHVCWDEFLRIVNNVVPDELQVWKKAKNNELATTPSMKYKKKEILPDKFDLDWRVKKVEDAIKTLEYTVQKLYNRVETMENMNDDVQNKF